MIFLSSSSGTFVENQAHGMGSKHRRHDPMLKMHEDQELKKEPKESCAPAILGTLKSSSKVHREPMWGHCSPVGDSDKLQMG